jgi:alpha-glucosidase
MDDGNTFAYQKGEFLRTHFTCEMTLGQVKVHVGAAEGPYHPWFTDMQVSIYGPSSVREVRMDGKPLKSWKAESGSVVVNDVPWTGAPHEIEIQYNNR